MNSEWKEAIRARRRAARRYRRTNAPEDLINLKKFRNEATRLRRKAIKSYWKTKAEDLKNKPQDFYKTFMPFLSSKSKCRQVSDIKLNINGQASSNKVDISEAFGEYFATIADGIGQLDINKRSLVDFDNHSSVMAIRAASHDNSQLFSFRSVKPCEVRDGLKKLKSDKAMGWDRIPPRALKSGANELAIPLANLFNICINQGLWPTDWKKGEWTPVHKKDDKLQKENYRPVTVQIVINKIFEQLLSSQITGHFNNRLCDHLTAYRKRHSCETALLYLTESWRHSLDNGECVGVLSTDMSKAFDCLFPPLMLAKLRAYSFDDVSLKLMASYFDNRQARVKLGNTTSGWRKVHRGCPQGSSFGRLMWNLYQNDLTHVLKSNISMYADDHQFFEANKDVQLIQTRLQESAAAATSWYKENCLQGNFTKYGSMLISKQKDANINIDIDGNKVSHYQNIKLLGVNIDSQLTFNDHISEICKKVSQRVGVMTRLRNLIPTTAKLQLYKAAVLPYLTYCSIAWHFCSGSDARKVERVQERGLRAVFCDWNANYKQLLELANLPTLMNHRLHDIAIIMYKVKFKLAPSYIQDLFSTNYIVYNLRVKNLLFQDLTLFIMASIPLGI